MRIKKVIDSSSYSAAYTRSSISKYFKKQGKYLKFVVDQDKIERLQNEEILYLEPIYEDVKIRHTNIRINEEMEGTILKDLSSIKNIMKTAEEEKTKREMVNKNAFTYLCAIPTGVKFHIFSGQHTKKLTAKFVSDKIYLYDNNTISRAVQITNVYNDKKVIEECPHKKKDNKQKQEKKKKDNSPKKEASSFVAFNDKDSRIKLNKDTSDNVFCIFYDTNAIKEIQLIKSANNHVTKRHKIENKVVDIVYFHPKVKKYSSFKIALHYCMECDKYFDFYESFIKQLKDKKIELKNIVINYIDNNNDNFKFDESVLKEHSLLNLYGYSVGEKGLSEAARHRLLERLIREKYMSAASIKSHIEFLIHFSGRRSNMAYAVRCWERDVMFVNSLIVKGTYERK